MKSKETHVDQWIEKFEGDKNIFHYEKAWQQQQQQQQRCNANSQHGQTQQHSTANSQHHDNANSQRCNANRQQRKAKKHHRKTQWDEHGKTQCIDKTRIGQQEGERLQQICAGLHR